jgi:2-polyprenyl-3-methyl-5-hydroxy-6-metoxy-1,4-benzoquinol methylase
MAAHAHRPFPLEPRKQNDPICKGPGDISAMVTMLAMIGDRLGLFRDLSARGPATYHEFAGRTTVAETYAREWLADMTAARLLEYEAASRRFALPAERVSALTSEGGAFFLGCVADLQAALATMVEGAAGATSDEASSAAERFEELVARQWVASVPDIAGKLRNGARVADIGSGQGRALIHLARAFPQSSFAGYEENLTQVVTANEGAKAVGVAGRVFFEQRHVAAEGLPKQYDVVTTHDVMRDAADPAALLRAIRRGLKPGGIYVCLESNGAEKREDQAGPMTALLYGFSILYCTSQPAAAGLGLARLPEPSLRDLCREAGLHLMRRVPLDDVFSALYDGR